MSLFTQTLDRAIQKTKAKDAKPKRTVDFDRTYYKDKYNNNKVWEITKQSGGNYYVKQFINGKQFGKGTRMSQEMIKGLGLGKVVKSPTEDAKPRRVKDYDVHQEFVVYADYNGMTAAFRSTSLNKANTEAKKLAQKYPGKKIEIRSGSRVWKIQDAKILNIHETVNGYKLVSVQREYGKKLVIIDPNGKETPHYFGYPTPMDVEKAKKFLHKEFGN